MTTSPSSQTRGRPFRVVLFGPESTGKTSLARSLSTRLAEPCSEEYVRRFWDEHQGRIVGEDLDEIARGQMNVEDSIEALARKHAILDTDLLTCTIWDDLLFPGRCPQWVREEANKRARRTDLFLLCLTDIPFEPDPQRCFPDEAGRAMCMRVFREALESRGLAYVAVGGAFDARLELAWQALRSLDRTFLGRDKTSQLD